MKGGSGRQGAELVKRFELDALLVTRSENGMTLIREGGQPELHLPAQAHEVYDVTGAGDTVISTSGDAAGKSLMRPAPAHRRRHRGRQAGDPSTVSPVELANALYTEQETVLASASGPSLAVQAARLRGEKVVMTNGCFDILHAGHVSYLAQCGQAGDRSIVAVNTDESVRALKGPGRRSTRPEPHDGAGGPGAVDWVPQTRPSA